MSLSLLSGLNPFENQDEEAKSASAAKSQDEEQPFDVLKLFNLDNFFPVNKMPNSRTDDAVVKETSAQIAPNQSTVGKKGKLFLSIPAREGDLDRVREIHAAQQSTTDLCAEQDAHGNTPCHWAALGGHVPVLTFLLDHGFSPSAANDDGDTPLHYAATGGSAAATQLLLGKGADAWAPNGAGATPLHFAAAEGHGVVARLLLARPGGLLGLAPAAARFDRRTVDGDTALHWAAASGLGGGGGSEKG